MPENNNVVLIGSAEIINVIRNALSKIDPRLVDHAERVAYIAKKIYEVLPPTTKIDFPKLFILCLAHDIGAYRMKGIDEIVKFETEKSIDHAFYGYVFLKRTTLLADCAEAILYHHTDYSVLRQKDCDYVPYAELIYLADRVDILLHTPEQRLIELKCMAGTKFNPTYITAFFAANEIFGISKKILSGEYRDEIIDTIKTLDVSNDDVMEYLKMFVYAIDFRSPYTITHTAATTIMSTETGKLMGLSEEELNNLRLGAFLHDIGKIAIPFNILENSTRLTDEEFEIIKDHIAEGESILRNVVNDEICDIAVRHHEKLDGSGYPRELTEKDLTLPQRIVAVADILSALSQRRSYKEAFPKKKVIALLTDMKNSGALSASVIDTICENYDFILEQTQKGYAPVERLYEDIIDDYKKYSQSK